MTLSQLNAGQPFIADGGLEPALIYLDGIDRPDFASFHLLDTHHGRDVLAAHHATYVGALTRLLCPDTGALPVDDEPFVTTRVVRGPRSVALPWTSGS